MTRLRGWLASPAPSWATTGRVLALVAASSTLAAIALLLSVSNFYSVRDERKDRIADADVGRERDKGLDRRVVRIERTWPSLCQRSPACRAAVRRQQPSPAPLGPGRKPRRDRDSPAPDQRADRPPRAPVQPPSTPSPTPGGGGDEPPPNPPRPVTPSTPPAAPQGGPVVDVPPIDIDGPDGLLPETLPRVNLPPVDLPPVQLPALPR